MFINIFILIISFIVLIKGADIFVEGAKSLAINFKVSEMLIALTIVAFGTSAPEFAVSIKSILTNNASIILGDMIGSNIFNGLFILGICSIIHPLIIKKNTIKYELPILILLTCLFIILLNDTVFDKHLVNSLSRADALCILLVFLVFVYYLFLILKVKVESATNPTYSMTKSIMVTIFGIICVVVGSNFVVDSASSIALILGVSKRVIALTIVSLGTSLPELVTSIIATIRGEYDIAVGNIIGSNIFNIGIVIGLPVLLFKTVNAIDFKQIDLIVLFITTLSIFFLTYKKRTLNKKDGLILLSIFLLYILFLIFF